jgi:Protein phosphatase 2C
MNQAIAMNSPALTSLATAPLYIGDAGRAARELPAGLPTGRPGLADVELSAATVPGVLLLAATVRGLQRRACGEPRQDAFAISHHGTVDEGARVIAVVCDGVGSLGRSEEAAALVSRRLACLGAAGLPWPEAFFRANEALREFAAESADEEGTDSAADGMATTAVALAVHRQARDWVGDLAWVGDSTAWHLHDGTQWTPLIGLGEEHESGWYMTAVRPLPSADGDCSVTTFRLSGGALFLMTDGVSNPLSWSSGVRETLARWWARPPDPFTFAAQVGFARKTHTDDRTVIGIWPDDIAAASDDRPSSCDVPGGRADTDDGGGDPA